MIGWLGFFGKVLDFFITKAAEHSLDLSLDRKHRAAKGLLRLYNILEESTALLEQLLIVFDGAVERRKPVLFSKDLVPFENRINYLSEDFRRHYHEFVDAVYIFNPQLAQLLQDIHGLKVQALTAFGVLLRKARFVIEFGGLHPFARVSFSTFDDGIANLPLDKIVDKESKSQNRHLLDMPRHPSNKLVECLSVLLIEDEFTASDFDKVQYLRDRLRHQRRLLEQAMPALRAFIASNFTISDALGYRKSKTVLDELRL